MKYKILFILLIYSIVSVSQNLVPNPSFEIHDSCPHSPGGQIYFAIPWFQPSITSNFNSTGDYFNTCSTNDYSVPNNTAGMQAAVTGNAYAGTNGNWIMTNSRGYIEVELTDTLKAGTKYCTKFYLSLADLCSVGINKMGMYFSKDSIIDTSGTGKVLPYIPQIFNADTNYFFKDKQNWMELSGVFTAEGGEKFLTIGNFDDDANTDTNYLGGFYDFAYYYIDDVSVTLCDDTTAVGELQITDYRLQIYPNPANDNITVTATTGNEIIITDIAGRKIKEYKLSGNQLKIKLDEYENGIYFIALYDNDRFVSAEKFCIAKCY